MAYLGRAGSEPQVSRRSSGTRCEQRDAVAAEAERALLPPDDAVSCPAPRTAPCTAQSTAPPMQCPEPCTSSATPNATPSATSCALSCPSLPYAPARALHSFATSSTAPCTAVHRPHSRLALRNPPTRCSLALASRPPAPPSSSSCFGEAQWLLVAVATEAPMAPAFHREPSAALYRKLLE